MAEAPNTAAPKGAQELQEDPVKREAQERKLFSEFLAANKALIADPASSSRVRLGHTLVELGAKQNNISFAGTYEEAAQAIAERKPRIILCEFALGSHSGLDLLMDQRKANPNTRDCIFALITGNTSQSAVAAAAEEDVDTFIIKPYTLETLKRTLAKAAIAKLYPSEYLKAIERGKTQLFGGRIDDSIRTFALATKLDPKPALACFYKGQAEATKAAIESASRDYKQGLLFNKIHYKCLIGLYELMMSNKNYREAYNIVKRIAQYFPANPKRLASVLRLAIMTESYEDVEAYYRIFTLLETRNDELVKYICAALIVTGRFYLMNNYTTRALELLEKAAISCAGKTSFLRHIIELLVEFDRLEEAKSVLKRFPPATQKGVDYVSMDLLIARRTLDTGVLIQKGRNVIKEGIHSPLIFEIVIHASVKGGLMDAARELCDEAGRKWPDQAERFKEFIAAGEIAGTGR